MVWNCSIVAVTLLFGVSGKSKAFRNESKTIGENDRAEYGKKLLEYLSEQLTAEFGKGFDKSNLRKMRQFYCTFPIRDTLCPELSWSHYRVLMRINDEQARRFYMEECAKAAWSVRQLERQINTMYYQRILE